MNVFILQTLFLVMNVLGTKSEFCPLDKDFRRAFVGLSLSPVKTDLNFREISIIWGNDAFKAGDKISLFTYSGTCGFRKEYELTPTTPYGTDETGIHFYFVDPFGLPFFEQCKRYYVAWIREGYIRKLNCLGNQPTWMYDRRDLLGSRKLANLFIPGTHDSGVYKHTTSSGSPSNQDQSVLDQLLQGIRYIHVQVGYHPRNNEAVWWIHKKNVPVIKLDTVIDDVITFLQNTREIVIFDVQSFPIGLEIMQDYMNLMDYLQGRFLAHLPPVQFTWNTPLHHIWTSSDSDPGKNVGKVLLNFNFNGTAFEFPALKHSFIKHTLVNSWIFQDYFEGLMMAERRLSGSTDNALQATLVTFTSRIFDEPSGESEARRLANNINPDIGIWYQKYWYPLANIVALDYFEASGIVDVAIRSNEFRYKDEKWSSEIQTSNCDPPHPQFPYSPEYVMNTPAVIKLLVPRVVDRAAEKIYDLIPELIEKISNKTLDFDSSFGE